MAGEAQSATREKMIAAGLALFRRRGVAAVTLADVARAAGVSRQSVYLHFGNRTGLLTEIARANDLKSPFAKTLRETSHGPASEKALETFVRTWFRNVPAILDLALALEAAGHADENARTALNNRIDTIATMVGRIVEGLHAQGKLNRRWTTKEATDWICMHLDPRLWHRWVVVRGWNGERFVDRIWETLKRELLSMGERA
jgi:AcrR family transcriptional regulator